MASGRLASDFSSFALSGHLSLPARSPPTKGLHDHEHAGMGFVRLTHQESMLHGLGERQVFRLGDGDGDAGLVFEELRRGDRLRRGARFRAEQDDRALVELCR
jgi:hypothetical protein